MVHTNSHRIPRVPQYLGVQKVRLNAFVYRSVTLFAQAFQLIQLTINFLTYRQIRNFVNFVSRDPVYTRVSNPVCSPRFRASVSVSVQEAAFATDVPPDIYAFHRYTGNSTSLYRTLV